MAKGRLMAYRLFIDDFDGGTSFYSNQEVGAYLRLLHYQFRYGIIPPDMFLKICEGDEKISLILQHKFSAKKGGFFNKRMEVTREEAIKFSEKQSIKGKKSVQQRFNYGSTTVEPLGSGSGSGIINNKKGVEFFEKCLNDEGWKESLMRATGIQTPVEWITKFNDHITSTEEYYPRLADYRRHCTHWVKLELEKIKNGKPKSKQPATIDQVAAAFSTPPVFVNLGDFSNVSRHKDQGSE